MKKTIIILGIVLNFSLMAGGYYLYYHANFDERASFQPETREIIQQCEGTSEDYIENIFLWRDHIIKNNKCLLKAINEQLSVIFENAKLKNEIIKSIAQYDALSFELADKVINYNKYCYLNCGSINERIIPYSIEGSNLERILDLIVLQKNERTK